MVKKKKDDDSTKILLGAAAVGGIGLALYFYFRKKAGNITVSVNVPEATWTIIGPEAYSGTGSQTIENAPEGTYMITFNDVLGYVTPPVNTQTMEKGGNIIFVGNYTIVGEVTAQIEDVYLTQ